MSRLDSFIRRMQAQRRCLDQAATLVRNLPGFVFELGLGNGRTYDHLRHLFPDRDIIVFDRKISAHPSCIPPEETLFLGEIHQTLPMAVRKFRHSVALVHSDIGTGDVEGNRQLALFISQHIPSAMCPNGLLVSDQAIPIMGTETLPLPPDVTEGRYFMQRFLEKDQSDL